MNLLLLVVEFVACHLVSICMSTLGSTSYANIFFQLPLENVEVNYYLHFTADEVEKILCYAVICKFAYLLKYQ